MSTIGQRLKQKMRTRVRSQRRIPGQRRMRVSSYILDELESRIREDMKRFNVSRSFVIATALSFMYDIHTESFKVK